MEGRSILPEVLNCAWDLGREKNLEKEQKRPKKEALRLIGLEKVIKEMEEISLNKIRKDKRVRDKLNEIKPARRIYVLSR